MPDQIPWPAPYGGTVSLRAAQDTDRSVLTQVFAESHCAEFEVLGLEPAALAGLVNMQYQARQAQYRSVHPGSVEYLIVGSNAGPMGSCWLDDTPEQLRVLDIAVLREHRGRGVARSVLGALCERAGENAKPVRLSVWYQNVAARELYRSLGFTGADGEPADDPGNGYLELQWISDRAARQRAGAR